MTNIITKLSRVSFIISILVIEYLATTSMEIEVVQNSWDKLNHFIAFSTLYILLYFAKYYTKVFHIVLTLLLYGIQIEIVQYFIPCRSFSLLDIFADMVGVLIGYIFIKYSKIEKILLAPKGA